MQDLIIDLFKRSREIFKEKSSEMKQNINFKANIYLKISRDS